MGVGYPAQMGVGEMHSIWRINLYERKSTEQGKQSDFVVCNACRENNQKKCELKISDGSVSTLIRHLKQHEEYKQKFDMLEDKFGEVLAIERFVVRPSSGLSSLYKRVINYVAENCVFLNLIESRSFISLFSSTNSTSLRSGHQSVQVKAEHVLIALIHNGYLDVAVSLTSHGIDAEWKRVKYVLAIRELPGSHTGANINRAIEKILEEWNIPRSKCHVFLRDGAANMKKLLMLDFQILPPLCWCITISLVSFLLFCYRRFPHLLLVKKGGLSTPMLVLLINHLVNNSVFLFSQYIINNVVYIKPEVINASGWLNTWWSFWVGNYIMAGPCTVFFVVMDRFLALKMNFKYTPRVQKRLRTVQTVVLVLLYSFSLLNVMIAWPYAKSND
uniref:Transposase n=1 Tax=Ditylenchus dipsaci TaxID=166011 RepID=A0A915EGC5_9BILA